MKRRHARRRRPTVAPRLIAIHAEVDQLPEGLWHGSGGRLQFRCTACGRDGEWFGEPAEFDSNLREHTVCGGSVYCLP